jgi:HSP20 family protein
MTTICNSVCENPATAVAGTPEKTGRPVYEPAADVIEKPDAIHVLLDLPGVDQKGLDVTIEEHILHVRRKSVATEKPESPHREIEMADYERTFRLTPDIDETRISAVLKNGLLRLVLPKNEPAKPQKISVNAE